MNDNLVCEECGSTRLVWVIGRKATRDHPEQIEGWECQNCGHFQAEKPDYGYYPDDMT